MTVRIRVFGVYLTKKQVSLDSVRENPSGKKEDGPLTNPRRVQSRLSKEMLPIRWHPSSTRKMQRIFAIFVKNTVFDPLLGS